MVVPLKRRATQQIRRKGASRRVSPHWPDCNVARLANKKHHSTRFAPRIRASEAETRLMGDYEIGSKYSG